jgi:HSP20 family protein
MSQVAVKKVKDAGKTLPIFEKIAQRFEAVQRRAFELFEKRGRETGHEVEDWLKAEHELFDWPAAKLSEKDSAYQLEISLPGFEAKDVEVTATPTEVIVHAATEQRKQTQEGNVLWAEFGSNEIYRRFDVANTINADRVTANLESGILRINAPKTAIPQEIKSAVA